MSEPAAVLARIPPHLICAEFLDPAEHATLLAWAIAQEASFAPSRLAGGRVDTRARDSLSLDKEALKAWAPRIRQRVRAHLPELCNRLGIKQFPVGRIEIQLLAYRDGAFFRRHIDVMRATEVTRAQFGGARRIVSGVYYFHAEPKGYSGGEVRLYPIVPGEVDPVDLVPPQNSLLAFPSWVPHEVLPVSCPSGRFEDSRFAINCWVHIREPGARPTAGGEE